MARITVEDCLKNVENRFDLVLKAAKRARELSLGSEATLPWENDKPTVMALREIAEGTIRTRELEAAEHFDIDVEQTTDIVTEEPVEGGVASQEAAAPEAGEQDALPPQVDAGEAPDQAGEKPE